MCMNVGSMQSNFVKDWEGKYINANCIKFIDKDKNGDYYADIVMPCVGYSGDLHHQEERELYLDKKDTERFLNIQA